MKADDTQLSCSTNSIQETLELGKALGQSLVGGLTIGLSGPLGAGKTQLVKGIALGNGLKDDRNVTSPTFTLIHEYPGRLLLYHLDAWRLNGPEALQALGFDELTNESSAVIVEWADRVAGVIPDARLWIEIASTGEFQRELTLIAVGDAANRCVASFQNMYR